MLTDIEIDAATVRTQSSQVPLKYEEDPEKV